MIVQLTTYQPPRTPQNGGMDESSTSAPAVAAHAAGMDTYGGDVAQRARLSRHRRAQMAAPPQQMGAAVNFSLFGERERLSNRRRAFVMTGAVLVTAGLFAFKAL